MNPTDPGRDHLLAELASSLMSAGRVAPAEDVCRALLGRDHDPRAEGPARICLGHALLAAGRPRDGLRELERAAESPMLTSAERASGLGWASIARMWLGDLDGSSATAEKAWSAASAAEDHMTLGIARAMSAVVSLLRGHLGQALEIIDDALQVADQSPGRQGHRYPLHASRGFILVELDRLDAAKATIDAGTRLSEELGIGWHLPSYQVPRTFQHFIAGEWDEAIAEVEASTALAAETGENFGLTLGRSILSLISIHRNDLTRAEQAVSAAVGERAETAARYRAQWAIWARALILEADGRTSDALATLAGCWDRCAQLGLTLEYRMFGPDLAVWGAPS